MSDDGYTLAEALAALAILGLAIGGLGLVVSLIARQQLTAMHLHNRLADARAADRALGTLVAGADLRDLQGDASGLSFACGITTCAARLAPDGRRTLLLLRDRSGPGRRLPLRAQNLRFSYVGAAGSVDGWPAPPRPDEIAPEQAPRAIILRSTSAAAPLAVTRIWRREPRDCQYDAIAGNCRTVTP